MPREEPKKPHPPADDPPPLIFLSESEFIEQFNAAKEAGQSNLIAFAAKIGRRSVRDWDCKFFGLIGSTSRKGIKVILGNGESPIAWCFLARSEDFADLELIATGTPLKLAGILVIDPEGLRFSKCKVDRSAIKSK
jgi:hypothetical protein